MTKDEIKKIAFDAGADLVGIAGMERWHAWEQKNSPTQLMPSCKSAIVLGKRILRGTLRGVEEGTNFSSEYRSNYLERSFLPRVVYGLAIKIEQLGYEAMPLAGGKIVGTSLQLDCKTLAQAAGLGEIGKGGFFLTRKYGHRQRLAMILTDLPLESDPPDEPNLCKACDACLKACPLQALKPREGEKYFQLNEELCKICKNGRLIMPDPAFEALDRMAASCGRACMAALENKIENQFKEQFRKRTIWNRDQHGNYQMHPISAKETSQ